MITLKQMTYFDALARNLHFGKAAEEVHISQPALSAQIAELETRLECRLVERSRSGVVLTEVGSRLLPSIRAVLADVRIIMEQAQANQGTLTGRFRLGIIPTLAPYLLPALAPDLHHHYPKLEFQVRESITETLVQQLHIGSLDAVVAAMPIDEPWIANKPLFGDRFHVVASENDHDILISPLNQHKSALDRLLLLEEGHCLRDQALELCETRSAGNMVNYGATSLTTLLEMVANGMGRTLLPEIAIPAETRNRTDIRIIPFSPPVPERQIALFFRKGTQRAADFDALAHRLQAIGNGIFASAQEILSARAGSQ